MSNDEVPGRELARALDEAFSADRTVGDGRQSYIDALVALARFADAMNLKPARARLFELAWALSDLQQGRIAPILCPVKRGGSPPDSSTLWNKRVRVLTAMYALQRSGLTQSEAAEYIAKNYPGLESLMKRGKNLASTIVRWQRELDEVKVRTPLALFAEEMLEMRTELDAAAAELNAAAKTSPDWKRSADSMLSDIDP